MLAALPDHRQRMFGRAPALAWLKRRARDPGVTFVTGGPLMGKTWTLLETARGLREDEDFIVGYHEFTGGESSHLLWAVQALYSAWLSDSSCYEQAKSLWARHRDSLVPAAGELLGSLFDDLGAALVPAATGGLAAAVARVVPHVFRQLALAQADLRSGGLALPQLPYEQAQGLTELVARISGRRVLLVLDSWERAPSLAQDAALLQCLVGHLDAWPATHVMLAVSSPDPDAAASEAAMRRVRQLQELSHEVLQYPLGPMELEDPAERTRAFAYVRAAVPVAAALPDDVLANWVSGFPGVIHFWTTRPPSQPYASAGELQQDAEDAHALRYCELQSLLEHLADVPLQVAARVAFLPRLDAEGWEAVRPCVLAGVPETLLDDLFDGGVLQGSLPSFGHETRHAAAIRWLREHRPALLRREAGKLLTALAARWGELAPCADPAAYTLYVLLARYADTAAACGVADELCALCRAMAAPTLETLAAPAFDLAVAHARQGHAAHARICGVLLATRAILRLAGPGEDVALAIADLGQVIDWPGMPADVVAYARIRRGKARQDDGGRIADMSAIIEQRDAPDWARRIALFERALRFSRQGRLREARSDYEAFLQVGAQAAAAQVPRPSASMREAMQGMPQLLHAMEQVRSISLADAVDRRLPELLQALQAQPAASPAAAGP